jgi:CTP synthase (UTP-ammonia lyase)
LLEYARNVLGYGSAEHAETNPHAELALIAPLSCALVEVEGTITLDPDTVIHTIYGKDAIEEGYHCRFGLNPSLEHLFASSDLRITGRDANGEARSFELAGRRFYLLTQFQPERAALKGSAPELVTALLRSAADGR